MAKARYSAQREAILKLIEDAKEHISAQSIYERVKKDMPKISLGTVYRNLAQLEESQDIVAMQGNDQVTYYETHKEPHHHFICKTCGTIENLDAPTVKTCVSCISQKMDLQIEEVITTLYGVCEKCRG